MTVVSAITGVGLAVGVLAGIVIADPADYHVVPVQLVMARPGVPTAPPPKKRLAAPPKQGSGLTAQEQQKVADALKQLTPKQRKRIAKAVKHMTPEERAQLAQVLKRRLEGKKPTQHLIQPSR